jgi:uncharacterized protein (DUF3820 family)
VKIFFGKYRGLEVRELPTEYLAWLYFHRTTAGELRQALKTEFRRRHKRQARLRPFLVSAKNSGRDCV